MAFNLPYRQPYKQPYYSWETNLERGDNVRNNALKADVATPRYSSGYDDEDGTVHIEHHQPLQNHHQHVPETPRRHHQRARFVNFAELPETKERRPITGQKDEKYKGGIISSSVDDEADGFIKDRHKRFEARQWSTFKM